MEKEARQVGEGALDVNKANRKGESMSKICMPRTSRRDIKSRAYVFNSNIILFCSHNRPSQ